MRKTYNQLKIELKWMEQNDVITASIPVTDDNETTPMPFPAFSPVTFDDR